MPGLWVCYDERMTVTPETAAEALLARATAEQKDLDLHVAEVRAGLAALVCTLRDELGATAVVLFGSLAWGGFHRASDVDVAVEGVVGDDYWRALGTLGALRGHRVDLLRLSAIPESFRQRVLSEGERLL